MFFCLAALARFVAAAAPLSNSAAEAAATVAVNASAAVAKGVVLEAEDAKIVAEEEF